VQTKDLAFSNAENELVFECKRTQIKPKKGPKTCLLWGIEVKICESEEALGWASTRGGYTSFEFDVSSIRNPPGAEPRSGQATGVAKCKEALDALHLWVQKVNEQFGDVYENKGSAFDGRSQSANVIEKKGSYAPKTGMFLKRKEVGGGRAGFRCRVSGVRG